MNTTQTRWAASISLPTGKRKTLTVQHKNPREAERRAYMKLADLQRQLQQGTAVAPTKLTLSQWVEKWLTKREADLRPTTLHHCRRHLALVRTEIGAVKLTRLTPLLLDDTFTRLRQQGHGTAAIRKAYDNLRTCLNAAVTLRLLAISPMVGVSPPGHQPLERRYWTAEEVARFIQVALHDPSH
jgi:site-specific recombinase XerC